jgi:hypothetical protein
VLSIDEGLTLGATDGLLNDDANLIMLCEACNLGQGKRSLSTGTYAAIVYRLLQAALQRRSAS